MIVSNNKEVGQVYRGTKQVKRLYRGEDIINDSVLNYENFTNNTCDINGFISNEIPKRLHIPNKICVMDAKKTAKTYKINHIAFDSAKSTGITSVFLGSNADGESEFDSFDGVGFGECSTLKIVYIGNSVKSIGSNMFYGCVNLNGVVVGKNLNEIGGFTNCSNLKGVILDQDTVNVTTIYSRAFYQCEQLKNIRILEKVESVGEQAFYRCSSLVELDFPKEVYLGAYVFGGCTQLKKISFSGGLTYNSHIWFKDCEKLETINYKGTKKSWERLTKETGWNENTGSYIVYCCEFNETFSTQSYDGKYAYGWDPVFEGKNLIDLERGDIVDVIFNGVTYSDLTVKYLGNSLSYYGVGNANIFDSDYTDTMEPFVFICNKNFINNKYYGATIMTMTSYIDTTLKIVNKIQKQ